MESAIGYWEYEPPPKEEEAKKEPPPPDAEEEFPSLSELAGSGGRGWWCLRKEFLYFLVVELGIYLARWIV